MTSPKKFFRIRISVVVPVVFASLMVAPFTAAIPVLDASNLSQNVISAMENVAHTAKQIQQYQLQLQQYENMIRNTTQPSQQIWDAATTTMNQLRSSIDTLSYYKQNLGSIDTYLARFKDTAAYRSHPCFSVRGCTQEQWAAMSEQEQLGSNTNKRATDAMFRTIDKQQNAMIDDAAQLSRLQSAASNAQGQLQAIGYANQLASHQTNQLMQIRALLIAQQNALAAREQ